MVTLRRPPQSTRSGPVLEPYQVIVRPLITEKATHVSERDNAYTFEVNPLATKTEIKTAIETLFDVKVMGVRTQNRRGKPPSLSGQGRPDADTGRRPSSRCSRNTGSTFIEIRSERGDREAVGWLASSRTPSERHTNGTAREDHDGYSSLQTDERGPQEFLGQ